MSGHKRATVTIDQEEYRRLHEADAKLRLIQKSQVDGHTIAHYQNAIHQEYDRLFTRQEQYQGWLESVNEQMRAIEGNVSQGFSRQQESIYSRLDQVSANLWTEVDKILQEQQEIFQNQINDIYQQQEIQLQKINRAVRSIRADHLRKENLTRSWIDAAETIANYIEYQSNHQKFTPGQLDDLRNELSMAEENLASGVPEAALATAQQAYRKGSRLRLELEYLQNQWQMMYLATCEMTDQVYDLVARNWRIQAIDLEGNEIDQTIDVDYWCGGRLSQSIQELESIRSQLLSDRHSLTIDDLNRIRTVELPEIENTVHECRFQARLAALSSQIRINIADVALCALEQQGFEIVKSGYDRHDQRSAFTATTRNMDGGEVIVKVIPSLDELGKNDLHLHSLDSEGMTRHELRLRAETIRRTLSNCGLEIGAMEAQKDSSYPDRTNQPKPKKISESTQKYYSH